MSSYTERQARIENKFSPFLGSHPRCYHTSSDNTQFEKRPFFEIIYRSFAYNIPFIIRDKPFLIGKSYKMSYASPISEQVMGKRRLITLKIVIFSVDSYKKHVL